MSDNTAIEWTDATWNPIVGCSVISPGCTNCYAMRLAGTRMKHTPSRQGLTIESKAGPVWNGEVRFMEAWLDQPLRWKRPRKIFVCAHGDLFHESVPDEWIDRVFAIMALAPQHTFQVLTKRAERMRDYLTRRNGMGNSDICRAINAIPPHLGNRHGALEMPLPNVWLGVSAEDQQRADERIPLLLETPAAVRFISAEPLLGPVVLRDWWLAAPMECESCDGDGLGGRSLRWCPLGACPHDRGIGRLDWVIAGGESGPRARPMHPAWARALRDQCRAAEVPFFFKQNGEFVSVSEVAGPGEHYKFADGAAVRRTGKKLAGATLDGREWRELPA